MMQAVFTKVPKRWFSTHKRFRPPVILALCLFFFSTEVAAFQKASQGTAKSGTQNQATFSLDVVAKAEKILKDHGLRRSGKAWQSTEASPLSRSLSRLQRSKRELKLLRQDWKVADDAVKLNRTQYSQLNRENGELNLQLARVAGASTAANNRLVGLINANVARQRILKGQLKGRQEIASSKRGHLSDAEADYAETILAIREDFTRLTQQINKVLVQKDVQTAIGVLNANFDLPRDPTAAWVLKSLDRRIKKIEQEIFSESIPLRVQKRSLYVDVVVGNKTTTMVVDSGSSMVCLPAKTADHLRISVPADAPPIRLVMADGRQIMGRRVTLPKMRIGNFEAENVDAVVLPATAAGAEPLLGMSYLGNFKFEIDLAGKSLKMLRVQAK